MAKLSPTQRLMFALVEVIVNFSASWRDLWHSLKHVYARRHNR